MIRNSIGAWGAVLVLSGMTARAADLLPIPLRINMGGAKTEDSLGRIWLRDGPGPGDRQDIRPDDAGGANWIENWNTTTAIPSVPETFEALGYDVNHPGDAYIFSTIRWDDAAVLGEYRLDIPVPNGDYQLNLYFNEACCKGRHFKVEVQGDIVDDDVSYLDADLTQPDPPLGMLFRHSFPARVTNEILSVGLLPCPENCVADPPLLLDSNAILNALEVISPNCDNSGLNFNCVADCETGDMVGTWFAHPGADGYRIIKNGAKLTDVPGNTFEFVDPDPEAGGAKYPTYVLQALDGGAVAAECRASVYTYCCPDDFTCTVTPDSNEVALQWSAPSAGVVTGYELRRNGELLRTLPADATSFEDQPTARSTVYEITPISTFSRCKGDTCAVTIESLPFGIPLRINMGGRETVDSHGDTWLGDGPGAGDPLNIRVNDTGGDRFIENWVAVQPDSLDNLGFDSTHAGDNYIFSTIRWDEGSDGIDFRLQLPVPNGDYKVNLYFNEGCCANRHFKIEIQGDIVHSDVDMTDYDPANPFIGRVGVLSFDGFNVSDGILEIAFLPCLDPECPGSGDDNAIINGIEVLPSALPIKVARSFSPPTYKLGDSVEVGLDIQKTVPGAPVLLKEVVPAGADVANISDGGILVSDTIEWDIGGVFNQKKVTYQISMGACEGDLTFQGSSWSSGPDFSGPVAGEKTLTRAVEDTTLGGWTRTSIGATGDAATSLGDHQVLLGGTGAGIKLTADEFSYVHVPASGDFEVSARIDCFAGPATTTVGLMVRDNLEPDASFAYLAIATSTQSAGSLRGIYRRESNANRTTSPITILTANRDVAALPVHLKVKRVGTRIAFERSDDGQSWTEVGSKDLGTGTTQLNLGENYHVGLASTPGAPGLSRAQISNVSGPSFTGGVPTKSFKRGDADANGILELTDAIFVLNNQFLGGPGPACMDAADADDSGAYDLTDAIFSLQFQFLGGPAPPSPGPNTCGPDPTTNDPFTACDVTCQ